MNFTHPIKTAIRQKGWRKASGSVVCLLAAALSLSAGQQPTATLGSAGVQEQAQDSSSPVTPLAKLVTEAQQSNPRVIAALRSWQAAAQVPSQVSTLPDPEIRVQHVSAGTPVPFDSFNSIQMTYLGVGVSQDFPYPGKLHLRGEVAGRKAASLHDQVESIRRAVAEQVKVTYYHLSYIQKTLEILAHDKSLLDQIEKIAEARYRVGRGNQQDVLKAQLQITKLLRDTTEYREQRSSLEARLKELVNRPQDSANITAETLTETPLPFSSDDLLSLVRTGNPEVSAEQQKVRGKSLGVELARKDFYPDFNVQYMWQKTGAPFPDRYSVSFGIKIPIYHSRRQQPELAQAAAQLNQSRRDYEAMVQQTYFDVKDQYLAADADAKVLKIYRQGLIPQAAATFQAGLAAYQSGQQDFQTLLASFLDVLNLDTEYWRTLTNHETALARLESLTGVALP
ncbi:MAG TPA: TolC family protein [Terriglobia bacterium]|nr:TolC family protein [Terriglobia bacterium]